MKRVIKVTSSTETIYIEEVDILYIGLYCDQSIAGFLRMVMYVRNLVTLAW